MIRHSTPYRAPAEVLEAFLHEDAPPVPPEMVLADGEDLAMDGEVDVAVAVPGLSGKNPPATRFDIGLTIVTSFIFLAILLYVLTHLTLR